MGHLRQGTCDQCSRSGNIIAKRLPKSGNWCFFCNTKRLSPSDKIINKWSKKPTKKATGEGALFLAIWNSRPHISFVSGKHLGSEAKSFYFAHVLPKSTYPAYRLFDRNIVLLTQEEHHAFDNGSREALTGQPGWDRLFALEQELKDNYYKEKEGRKEL